MASLEGQLSEPTEQAGQPGQSEPEPESTLPPLSQHEFRKYNRLAEHMEYFHSHFRQSWTMMHKACVENKRPGGMTIRQFIDEGLHFVQMLEMHHSIEEARVFPMLAKKMPEFQAAGGRKAKGQVQGQAKNQAKNQAKGQAKGQDRVKGARLVQQHRAIHVGLVGFEEYLKRCRSGEADLELAVLQAQMDTWGEVLWQHLDEEVQTLGADNMRRYWTLEEMQRLRM